MSRRKKVEEAFETFERQVRDKLKGSEETRGKEATRVLTIRLPESLWERVHKARIALRKRSANELIIEAIEAHLRALEERGVEF